MREYADLALFIAALPFGLLATYFDLKLMIIPNKVVLGLMAAFLIVGLIFLPFQAFLWQLLGGFIILAIGFVLNAAGLVGGGDAKFAAAMALFVPFIDALPFLFMLAIITLIVVALHYVVGKLPFAAPITTTWKSWAKDRKFPMGFGFGPALIYYTATKAFGFQLLA